MCFCIFRVQQQKNYLGGGISLLLFDAAAGPAVAAAADDAVADASFSFGGSMIIHIHFTGTTKS